MTQARKIAKPLPAEVDGVSLKPLFLNPNAILARQAGGLIFHRPGNRVSVIRDGEYKLLVNWDRKGGIASRELYRFAPDPREQDRELPRNAIGEIVVRPNVPFCFMAGYQRMPEPLLRRFGPAWQSPGKSPARPCSTSWTAWKNGAG